jgi:dephospho-CoA kinase
MGSPAKVVIGLTGNIASGKSLVRRMLEDLGVFSVDTDSLGHRLYEANSESYHEVVRLFGAGILDPAGSINRAALAGIVFSDPAALRQLEAVIHPPVFQAARALISHAEQPAAVLESIILLESSLTAACDTTWVVACSRETQIRRLMEQRGLSQAQAVQRIDAQSPQGEKIARADVVIWNDGDVNQLGQQVKQQYLASESPAGIWMTQNWQGGSLTLTPVSASDLLANTNTPPGISALPADEIHRRHWLHASVSGQSAGLIGLRFENLLCVVDAFYINGTTNLAEIWPALRAAIPAICRRWQCEAALLAVPAGAANGAASPADFQPVTAGQLPVSTWREHAIKLQLAGSRLFYQQYQENLLLIDPPTDSEPPRD